MKDIHSKNHANCGCASGAKHTTNDCLCQDCVTVKNSPSCDCDCDCNQTESCDTDCKCGETDDPEGHHQHIKSNTYKQDSAKPKSAFFKPKSLVTDSNSGNLHSKTAFLAAKKQQQSSALRSNDCNTSALQSIDDHCGCGRCATISIQQPPAQKNKPPYLRFLQIGIAAALCIAAFASTLDGYITLALFLPAYLIVGGEYLWRAAKNIMRGKIFDENFLMTIATIGAFAIGEYFEAVAVMLLYSIGETLQDFAVDKSKRNITGLLNLKAKFCNILTGSQLIPTLTDNVKIGQSVVVGAGEKVPIDGIIIDGETTLDYASLNGEFAPKHARLGDEILAGSINLGGAITISTTKNFKDTTVAKIIDLVEKAQNAKPKTQKLISKFAKIYTPFVVATAAFIAFVLPAFYGYENFAQFVQKALVFLVISCPCALVISVPLSFFAGIGGASKAGVLIKGGNHLEALNTIDTIVFDKTGTLTKGVFEVTDFWCDNNISREALLEYAAFAEAKSNHPIAQSIRKAYAKPIVTNGITSYQEVSGNGVSLVLNGSVVLCGKKEFLVQNSIHIPQFSLKGTVVYLARDNKFLGALSISDAIKDDAKAVITTLRKLNKKLVLLSGDNEETVSSVANTLEIADYRFGLLPQDKAGIVTQMIAEGKKVAFVGDGLNDAPVLKLATVGICMSGLGNDASVEASDIVLSGGSLAQLLHSFKTAAKTRKIVVQNIALSLAIKAIIMTISLVLMPSMWLAIIADVGVSLLAILNSTRVSRIKKQ